MKCRLVPFGRGLLMMKKSPAALDSRPSKSQQQIISSSGVQACARHRSTCTAPVLDSASCNQDATESGDFFEC